MVRILAVTVDAHGRWPWGAAALLAPSWGLALSAHRRLAADDAWIAALGAPILFAHQTEEWVRPGGFLPLAASRPVGRDGRVAFSAGLPLAMKARQRRA